MYDYELELLNKGHKYIAGCDEVGRGPLAGPLVAAAVILDPFNKIEGLNDSVVIIDTYTRVKYKLEARGYDNPQILTLLERIREFYNLTLIVIGHTRNFVGKDGIFDDNTVLARGVSEELFLEKSSYKETKVLPAHIKYNLHVIKGRGNGGAQIIKNWGREYTS